MHHSYVFEGDLKQGRLWIENILEKKGLDVGEIYELDYDKFTIEDSKDLRRKLSLSSGINKKRVFLLNFNSINTYAQNALLKSIEEPASESILIFCVKDKNIFLPTILSRCELVYGKIRDETDISKEIKLFLKGGLIKRLELIDEWHKSKNLSFSKINQLVRILEQKKLKISEKRALLAIKKYLNDQSFNSRLAFIYFAIMSK